MAILIVPDQKTSEVEPKTGSAFSFPQLYRLLNCKAIEIINLGDGQLMIVSVAGKLKPKETHVSLKLNRAASIIARYALTDAECRIVGRALIVLASEVEQTS